MASPAAKASKVRDESSAVKVKSTKTDLVFEIANVVICSLILIVVSYPLIYVISASFSKPIHVINGTMVLLPVEFNLDSYKRILSYANVVTGYLNSLFLLVVGTSINMLFTILGAYPLSRRDLYGRNLITMLFAFTMFFSGGLIPTYLIVQQLHMLDTRWSLIIPSAISMYNLIVMRTFFQNSIPESLVESARLDGATNMQVLSKVVLPLSKSILAVVALFYGVAHWNQYFNALIYITDKAKYPLQIILREILLLSQMEELVDVSGYQEQMLQGEGVKYALIIVASLPVMILYPLIQKHFTKGVMIGAIKE